MKCTSCNEKLKQSNTSCSSLAENMCQDCHTDMINAKSKNKSKKAVYKLQTT